MRALPASPPSSSSPPTRPSLAARRLSVMGGPTLRALFVLDTAAALAAVLLALAARIAALVPRACGHT
eukprot:9563201-Alexandrium_andersonii.AAC.1